MLRNTSYWTERVTTSRDAGLIELFLVDDVLGLGRRRPALVKLQSNYKLERIG